MGFLKTNERNDEYLMFKNYTSIDIVLLNLISIHISILFFIYSIIMMIIIIIVSLSKMFIDNLFSLENFESSPEKT